MEPKRSKYDTNPLDERVGERATESFSSPRPAPTEEVRGATTANIGRAENEATRLYLEAEAPTRLIDDKVTSYPSVFVPPKPREAPTYQPPRAPAAEIYQPPPGPPLNTYRAPPMPVT